MRMSAAVGLSGAVWGSRRVGGSLQRWDRRSGAGEGGGGRVRRVRWVTNATSQLNMFDTFSERLADAMKDLQRAKVLTKENMAEPMKAIRRSLLEADVPLKVAREFCDAVQEQAVGTDVIPGVKPEEKIVAVVYNELVRLMGEGNCGLNEAATPGETQIVLMAGLQGAGKTTCSGKLALRAKGEGKRPLLIACDVYRPGAIDQLVRLGEQIEVPVYSMGTAADPVDIARKGLEEAKRRGCDFVVVDTAGRLAIDEDMMRELKEVKRVSKPCETLLVVDGMIGQQAGELVKEFNAQIGITGAVLTKLDGDTRGGAALSVYPLSGAPVKFAGVGEKMEDLEPFYPDRMAQRILGMGDVLSLVERMEKSFDVDKAKMTQERMIRQQYDYTDFLDNIDALGKMGNFSQFMNMLPGMSRVNVDKSKLVIADEKMIEYRAMVMSMTQHERRNPEILLAGSSGTSRRLRVARGSGKTEKQVSDMQTMFGQMRQTMQNLGGVLKSGMDKGLSEDEIMKKMMAEGPGKMLGYGGSGSKKGRGTGKAKGQASLMGEVFSGSGLSTAPLEVAKNISGGKKKKVQKKGGFG